MQQVAVRAWHEFCDWYLEAVKPRLVGGDPAARAIALRVLDVLMRLPHPFMPFITEELWHRLPGERDFLVRTEWPAGDPRRRDLDAEREVERMIGLVEEVRVARKAAGAVERGGRLVLERPVPPEVAESAARLARVEVADRLSGEGTDLAVVAARVEFPAQRLDEGGRSREVERLRKELANADFVAKAPPLWWTSPRQGGRARSVSL